MSTLIEELTIGPLAIEIAPYLAQGNDGEIFSILTRKDRQRLGRITSHDIKQYFSLIGLRIPIMESLAISCKEVTLALDDFPVFDLTLPLVQAKFIALLDSLVEEALIPDFTLENKLTLLALATETVSRVEELALPISIQQIAQARELL